MVLYLHSCYTGLQRRQFFSASSANVRHGHSIVELHKLRPDSSTDFGAI